MKQKPFKNGEPKQKPQTRVRHSGASCSSIKKDMKKTHPPTHEQKVAKASHTGRDWRKAVSPRTATRSSHMDLWSRVILRVVYIVSQVAHLRKDSACWQCCWIPGGRRWASAPEEHSFSLGSVAMRWTLASEMSGEPTCVSRDMRCGGDEFQLEL